MAELLKIQSEVKEFQKEYFYRNSQAEENRPKENQAAIRIQSWFRACKVRAYLSHLHKKAVIIQKIWRGFTARARFRQMVKAAYFIMKMNFYEEMAVRIQRTWRGFFVRKYIHNFYARKSYLEELSRRNELVRRELDELEELQKRERECLQMVKEQTAKVYQAHRLHHLLSTKQCRGVFNPPVRTAPHEMEQLLRQVKYQAPIRMVPRGRDCLSGKPGPADPSFPGTPGSPWIKTTRTGCSSRTILPPIASKKQQRRHEEDWPLVLAVSHHYLWENDQRTNKGLSREPGEVWEQRLQCPDLMLGLQTSHTHLEEAQNQLRQHESLRHTEQELCSTICSTAAPLLLSQLNSKASDSGLHSDSKRSRSRLFTTCNIFDKFPRLHSCSIV